VSEETGLGVGAARTRETVLAKSVRVPSEADRAVAHTLSAAYGSVLRARRQLDAIAVEADWQYFSDSKWPWAGNWRYLADYALSQTLAYPERVEYRQDNDTFALYRKIYTAGGA
jgi:uncharacterized protein DUF4226